MTAKKKPAAAAAPAAALAGLSPHLQAAVVRGIRTFVAAFLAVYGAPALLGALSGSQPLDTTALRSAAVAGIAGVISLIWRATLDRWPVPSLKDVDQPAPNGQ